MKCKESMTLLEKKTTFGYLLSQKDMSVVIHHSIHDIGADWETAAPTDNIFLQRTYLQLLEDNPPENTHFLYLLFYKKSKPVGVSIGQVGNFNAGKSLNEDKNNSEKEGPCPVSVITNFVKNFVAKKVDINAIVFGNILLTGEHHNICFHKGEVNEEQAFHILNESVKYVEQELDKKGVKINLVYIKEYNHNQKLLAEKILVEKYKFHEFTAQPNMVLNFRKEWNSFEDYMAAMSSKYRVRVKRAFKKGQAIERREFGVDEIKANLTQIYELYESVAERSVFNLVKLNPQYFLALKEKLGDDFQLTAYYIDGEMAAFYTTIKNHDELEAHFLGCDNDHNREYQVYLNILYDIVKSGFRYNCKTIVFARTALEIKSSVGAEPQEMFWYLRHRNGFSNRFLSKLVDYINPKDDWTQRKPFKEKKG